VKIPEPVPGLVIRYSYLWQSEFVSGRDEGSKDRPASSHVLADLIEMGLHGVSVGIRHDDGRANVARRTNGTEQIGIFITLIFGLARSCAAFRPLVDEAVLLADAGFVLEPDFDRSFRRDLIFL
jgi:hypothetical protein